MLSPDSGHEARQSDTVFQIIGKPNVLIGCVTLYGQADDLQCFGPLSQAEPVLAYLVATVITAA